VGGEKPAPQPQSVTVQNQTATANDQQRITSRDVGFISPVVAKIAAEHGVNLSQVQGTGLNGRITKNDVLNYVESGKKTMDNGQQTITHRPSSMVTPAMGDQLIKHTVIRKQIAEHMV